MSTTTESDEKTSPATLCRVCKDWDARKRFQWHELGDIRNAAADGCPYCHIVLQALDFCCRDMGTQKSQGIQDRADNEIILFRNDKSRGWSSVALHEAQWHAVELFTLSDSNDTSYPQDFSHLVSGNTRINCNLPQVKQWVHDCLSTHVRCNLERRPSNAWPPMPKRLVDTAPIDEQGSVRLVEPEDLREPYLCLSHCWGGTVPLRTMQSNIHEHYIQIGWQDLPQTFQDAIDVVRLLGQRYLWIDSLCIIQDGHQDWDAQSAQMATIYQNAFLTLAATKARDSSEGLYSPVNNFTPRPVAAIRKDGRMLSLLCRRRIPHFFFPQPSSGTLTRFIQYRTYVGAYFPLLVRAWVLQERLLSPRILHFGPAELLWECREYSTCECLDGIDTTPPMLYPKTQHADSLDMNSGISRPEMWRNIVRAYSQLHITDVRDRLPALQGIATQLFESNSRSKIISGLCEEDMLFDLMWHASPGNQWNPKSNQPEIPSWSWAKMFSWIWTANTQFWFLEGVKSVNEHAKFEGCKIAEGEDSQRIMNRGTHLRLSAQILPGKMSMDDSEATFVFDHRLPLTPQKIQPDSASWLPWMNMTKMDWSISDPGPHQIKLGTILYCLRLATIDCGKERLEWGMLVKHAENGRMQFERVGSFVRTHYPDHPYELMDGHATSLEELFEGAERTTITLI